MSAENYHATQHQPYPSQIPANSVAGSGSRNYMHYMDPSRGYENGKYDQYTTANYEVYNSGEAVKSEPISANSFNNQQLRVTNSVPKVINSASNKYQNPGVSQAVNSNGAEQPYYPQQPTLQKPLFQNPKPSTGFEVLNRDSLSIRDKSPPTHYPVFPIGDNYYLCPLCAQTAIRTCGCEYRDAECSLGHKWFLNSQQMRQIGISPGHAPRMETKFQASPSQIAESYGAPY
jgi:hypothetical protein